MRAQNNSLSNDSIHSQFSDSVNSSGTPKAEIGYDLVDRSRPAGWSERRGRPWLGMVGQRMGRARVEYFFRDHRHAHDPCAAAGRRRDRRSDCHQPGDLSEDRAGRAPERRDDPPEHRQTPAHRRHHHRHPAVANTAVLWFGRYAWRRSMAGNGRPLTDASAASGTAL